MKIVPYLPFILSCGAAIFLLTSLSEPVSAGETKNAVPKVIPALGRPFALGALYDVSSDRVISGLAPWNLQSLGNKTIEKDTPNVKAHMSASESFSERSIGFHIDASVKLSFLGGMLTITGSAGFMLDISGSTYEAAVNFFYHRRTHTRQLSMDCLTKPDYPDAFTKNLHATHVVTGIEYGANVIFKFSKKTNTFSSKVEVTGALAKGMKSGMSKGKTGIADRKIMNTTTAKYFGDVQLGNPPVTFDDSVEAYRRLPSLINKTTAIPLLIHLTPVALLKQDTGKLLREISNYLLSEVSQRMENYDKIQISIKDLKDTPAFENLNTFRGHINGFEQAVKVHRGALQTKLNRLLPNVRGGGKAEEELSEVLDERYQLINIGALNNYLYQKEKEAGALSESTTSCPEAILHKAGEFKTVLFDTKIQYVVVFTFYLYAKKDNFTECINHNCGTKRMLTDQGLCKSLGCELQIDYKAWTDNKTLGKRIRTEFRKFKHVYEQNKNTTTRRSGHRVKCVIRSELKENTKEGFAIEVYQKGKMVESHLFLPEVSNLKRNEKKKGFILSWSVKVGNGSKRWFTDTYLVQYRHPSQLYYQQNMTVTKKTNVFIPSVCDVEVRVNIKCKFGMCGYATEVFKAIDHDDVSCDKLKLKILKEKQDRAKAFAKKHVVTDAERFNKTRIILAGGKDAKSKKAIQNFVLYSPSTHKFEERKMQTARYGHVAASLPGGKILLAGGYVKAAISNEAEIITVSNGRGQKVNPMTEARAYAASAVDTGAVYVCGGKNSKDLNTCEKFGAGKWAKLAQTLAQANYGAAMVAFKGYLYYMGGRTSKKSYSNAVYKYSLKTQENWFVDAKMNETRADFGAVVLKDSIYACGGLKVDNKPPRSSCEVYTKREKKWITINDAPMYTPRASFTLLAPVDGHLYAVGGYYTKQNQTKQIYQSAIDVFDHKELEWNRAGEINGRSEAPAVIIVMR